MMGLMQHLKTGTAAPAWNESFYRQPVYHVSACVCVFARNVLLVFIRYYCNVLVSLTGIKLFDASLPSSMQPLSVFFYIYKSSIHLSMEKQTPELKSKRL
jgi:hypothetical protein